MKLIEVFGDGRALPNGWHRYVETHYGRKWIHLLRINKLKVVRLRKEIYDKMLKQEVEAPDWEYYGHHLAAAAGARLHDGRKIAGQEVEKVLAWIKENH